MYPTIRVLNGIQVELNRLNICHIVLFLSGGRLPYRYSGTGGSQSALTILADAFNTKNDYQFRVTLINRKNSKLRADGYVTVHLSSDPSILVAIRFVDFIS